MPKTPYRYLPGVTPAFRAGRRLWRLVRHAGSAVHCVCCERSFSKWLDDKPTGPCPNCVAITRQKFLVHVLESRRKTGGAPFRTLYFAPDPGPILWFARAHEFVVTTTDLSAPDVDVHMDITALDTPDASYDVVICSHVLEHIPDDRKAMAELRRITTQDGVVFIQVPYARDVPVTDEDPTLTDSAERIRRFGQFDHVRCYGRDLLARLNDAGFEVETVTVDDTFDAATKERFGLWNDIIFICKPVQISA